MNTSMEQPETPQIKQPPILFNKTQTHIAEINALLGGTLITYWNNPEVPSDIAMRPNGKTKRSLLHIA